MTLYAVERLRSLKRIGVGTKDSMLSLTERLTCGAEDLKDSGKEICLALEETNAHTLLQACELARIVQTYPVHQKEAERQSRVSYP